MSKVIDFETARRARSGQPEFKMEELTESDLESFALGVGVGTIDNADAPVAIMGRDMTGFCMSPQAARTVAQHLLECAKSVEKNGK